MAPTATLLAHTPKDSSALTALIAAIDAQTVPYSGFDVIYLVPEDAIDTASRLAELAQHRPNVSVVAPAADVDIASAGDAAAGDWLVHLGPRPFEPADKLLPDALEQLMRVGEAHGCDLVVGRADRDAGRLVNDYLTRDGMASGPVPPALLTDCFPIAVRREFAVVHGVPHDAAAAERILSATDKVGVLGRGACLVLDGTVVDATGTPSVDSCSMVWRDGCAVFTISGSVPDVPAGAQLRFAVRRGVDRNAYWIDVESTGASLASDGTFEATVSVDVRTAADGRPLPDGRWQVTVGAHGDGLRWSRRAALPPLAAGPALVGGRPVVPMQANRRLALDVGATRAPVIPRLGTGDVTISDSVRGTRLTARLTDLAVAGDATLPGFVLLGTFRLPADVVARDGRAELVSTLSGLAGTSELKTKFGWCPPHPTGLSLVISPTGQMSVVPVPPPQPATAKRPGPTAVEAPASRPSPVSRMRRAVPAPLEPAVRALARNRVARRAYRRLSELRATRR